VATAMQGRARAGALSRLLFPTGSALAIALFVCVVAPVTLVALQIDANPKFSPLDEAAHFDYIDRVADGEVPRQGQELLPATLRTVACTGNALAGARTPPCTAPALRPEQFPGRGSQYEAQQPPTYYALTVPVRWVTQHVLGVGNRLDATRAASIAWLVAGLLLAWAAGRVMAIDPFALGAALLLIVGAPTVIFITGSVSNDVTAVPAGAMVALVAALAHRRDGPRMPVALFAAGFAAAALKTSNIMAVGVVSALFAVSAARAVGGRPAGAILRRWARDGGALLLGSVLAICAWVVVHRSLALIDLREEPAFEALRRSPHTIGVVLREAVAILQPLTGDLAVSLVSAATLDRDAQRPLYALLGFVVVSAGLAGLFVTPRRWPHVLGLIAVPALYLGGVALGLSLLVTYQIDPGLGGRYGLSIAPLLVLALAAALEGRWAQRAVATLGLALVVTTFVVMVT
jgi:hypothetical protein